MLDPLQEQTAVTVGNGATVKAIGKGVVTFDFPSGSKLSVDALYVPGIHHSLLSVSQLNNIIPVTFLNGYCDGGSQRIGTLQDGLYELQATPVHTRLSCATSRPFRSESYRSITTMIHSLISTLPSLEMWHFRLGHLGLESLKKLVPLSAYSV